jgi:hypothetical protein
MRETWVSQVTGGIQDHTRYFMLTPQRAPVLTGTTLQTRQRSSAQLADAVKIRLGVSRIK